MNAVVVLGSAASLACAPLPQIPGESGEVLARYTLNGKRRVIVRHHLARELARRHRNTERGRAAREFLVDLELIRNAATATGTMPDGGETRAWIADLEKRLRAAGMNLNALMAQKGMTRFEFEQYAALQLAHERLVRRSLGLGPTDQLDGAMMKLWLEEQKRKQGVVVDPASLAEGVVATVGSRRLTVSDLGIALIGSAPVDDKRKHVRDIIYVSCLDARAKAAGVEVTHQDMVTEVEARRAEAATNPALSGATFEEILQSQGTSVAELERSPVLRAQIQERRLAEVLLTDADLDKQIAEDRARVLREHGARRRVHAVMVAADAQGAAAARERLLQVRDRITGGLPFDEAARTYSEDPYGKVRGGDTGWHHMASKTLPPQVVDAAFAAKVDDVSQPIATDAGAFLIKVSAIEAPPNDETLKFRMRQAFAVELRRRIVREAQIEFVSMGGGR